jgi:release factor glutamine methyltransferase
MTNLTHIRFKKPEEGYAPSDDSWLLANALEKENFQGKKCLDMGCGSGIQTAALLLGGAEHVTCVDINSSAIFVTQKMVQTYFPHAKVEYVEGNLFEHVKGKFDVMVFNPPYVPSDEMKWMEVDGGKEGREVIDKFMSQFPKHLKENGSCFLLVSSLNGIDDVQFRLQKRHLKSKVVAQLKLSFEELYILKITPE